ncbi:MAG: hypothetical protein ACYTAO_08515 [Planctomycetota bacterium]|jgi:hypothetical protein
MKHILVALSTCLLSSAACGTPQIPEELLYKAKEYRLACAPLEKYFDANHPKPQELRRISTACLRGYVGTWEIRDKKLYLKSLGRFPGGASQEIPVSLVFKDREPPVEATWYTGLLRMPHGERIGSIRRSPTPGGTRDLYISVIELGTRLQFCEKDLYLGVVRGNIISEHLVDNRADGATRSVCDWGWVASGSDPINDDLKWHDPRVVASDAFFQYKVSRKSFRTRGVYFNTKKTMTPELWIPPTLATKQSRIMLNSMPENYEAKLWQHVEITAHFQWEPSEYSLHVDSIRPLKPGETMHHPDFKPPDKPSE